jgi:mannose-6-phosphate isomerase-like protein (cupin superfamily)
MSSRAHWLREPKERNGMNMPGEKDRRGPLRRAHPFDTTVAKERLAAGSGGYEVVYWSPGLELGLYVLVAPEPDRQRPHDDDEVYVVLEGSGVLEVEEERVELGEGHAIFVPARAEHRFVGYEQLSLLVIFDKEPPP